MNMDGHGRRARLRVAAVGVALAVVFAFPAAGSADPDRSPDTGQDLHAALLGSGPPGRVAHAAGVDLADEYLVYSLGTDSRWITLTFDVAAAELTGEWLQFYLAARLMRDGEVTDEWYPLDESVLVWHVFSGPAEDPHRNLTRLLQDTPWGMEVAWPAAGIDTMTLLLGVDVDSDSDVGLVLAVEGTDDPFLGEPLPEYFPQWLDGWTHGRDKVRLVEDAHGGGVRVSAWLGGSGEDPRREVAVDDDRVHVGGVAGPGSMRATTRHGADAEALSTLWLSYGTQGAQEASFTWESPLGTRQGGRTITGSGTLTARAVQPAVEPGASALTLAVDTLAELGSGITLVHTSFALDPDEVFGGLLAATFTSDPPSEEQLLLGSGLRPASARPDGG